MNKTKIEEQFESFGNKQFNILLAKGDDYANEDRLSNFKVAGAISGLSAEIDCLVLIATKVARLGVLLNNKNDPKNESIRDSVLDLANYVFLLDCILEEKTLSSPQLKLFNENE